jgi:hypothetical protein
MHFQITNVHASDSYPRAKMREDFEMGCHPEARIFADRRTEALLDGDHAIEKLLRRFPAESPLHMTMRSHFSLADELMKEDRMISASYIIAPREQS